MFGVSQSDGVRSKAYDSLNRVSTQPEQANTTFIATDTLLVIQSEDRQRDAGFRSDERSAHPPEHTSRRPSWSKGRVRGSPDPARRTVDAASDGLPSGRPRPMCLDNDNQFSVVSQACWVVGKARIMTIPYRAPQAFSSGPWPSPRSHSRSRTVARESVVVSRVTRRNSRWAQGSARGTARIFMLPT